MDAARRLPGEPLLGDRRLQHRRTCRGRAARSTTSSSRRSRSWSARRCRSRSPAGAQRASPSAACSRHAIWRSVVLIAARHLPALAAIAPTTYWTFEDTLTQIGLGYTFLFLLAFASLRVQVAAFVGDPRRLLGGVRAVSAAAARLRLPAASACRPTGRISTRASSRTSTRTRTSPGRSTSGSSTCSRASRRSASTAAAGPRSASSRRWRR